MKKIFFTLTALFFAAGLFAAHIQASPQKSAPELKFMGFQEAADQAAKENKHVMIYFWADWCQYCNMFNQEVLTDAGVQKKLAESFTLVSVDVEDKKNKESADLARKFGARAFPMVVFLDPKGEKAALLPGYLPPEVFTLVLDYVTSKAYLSQDIEEYFDGLDIPEE